MTLSWYIEPNVWCSSSWTEMDVKLIKKAFVQTSCITINGKMLVDDLHSKLKDRLHEKNEIQKKVNQNKVNDQTGLSDEELDVEELPNI